jgi:hypothetical protein
MTTPDRRSSAEGADRVPVEDPATGEMIASSKAVALKRSPPPWKRPTGSFETDWR